MDRRCTSSSTFCEERESGRPLSKLGSSRWRRAVAARPQEPWASPERARDVPGSSVRSDVSAEVSAGRATRSNWCKASGAMARTSTPSAQGRVDSTTASRPKARRTCLRASRDVGAVKRLTFMPGLR